MSTCYVKGCQQEPQHNTTFPNTDNITVCDNHYDQTAEWVHNSALEVIQGIRILKVKIRNMDKDLNKRKGEING